MKSIFCINYDCNQGLLWRAFHYHRAFAVDGLRAGQGERVTGGNLCADFESPYHCFESLETLTNALKAAVIKLY